MERRDEHGNYQDMEYSQKQGGEPFTFPASLLIIYRQSVQNGWRCISGRCKCNAGCRACIRTDVLNKTDIWKRVRTAGLSCRPFVSCGGR